MAYTNINLSLQVHLVSFVVQIVSVDIDGDLVSNPRFPKAYHSLKDNRSAARIEGESHGYGGSLSPQCTHCGMTAMFGGGVLSIYIKFIKHVSTSSRSFGKHSDS